MTRSIRSLSILLVILMGTPILAAESHLQMINPESIIQSGSANAAKTVVDTLLLIGPHGSGAWYNGQFEAANGTPNWQGWTSQDLTKREGNFWHISTYNAADLNAHGEGNHALWCGSIEFPSCDESDEDGGYGNNWYEIIDWYGTVEDGSQPCNVGIEAWMSYDLEPGYDYLFLKAMMADDNTVVLFDVDGQATNEHLLNQVTYSPIDYLGENGDQVHLQFVVTTDGSWSDQDCLYPTIGACQIDDIRITMDNGGIDSLSEFEDGTMGDWELGEPPYVGDFAKLWMSLEDIDPCATNSSSQVAFIDDGQVVPGTGGTMCIDWCYGPGGYVVNPSGGLAGDDFHLNNIVLSPVMDVSGLITAGYQLEYDFYSHEDFSFNSPGIFVYFQVRSTTSDDPAALEFAPWVSNNFIDFLPGQYMRLSWDVSSLVEQEAKYLQVSIGALELGFQWGIDGLNSTPAPYIDNVRLSSFPVGGPHLRALTAELAQDGFPASGQLDLDNLASNSVRFDMARAVNPSAEPMVVSGDSIICEVVPLRDDAVLFGEPKLHYRLKANPVFDDFRTSGLPNLGSVDGWVTNNSNGNIWQDHYAFDLPDEGFLFPGDILHYYIAATDDVLGDHQTSTLPADTTGFSKMDDPLAFDPVFTVRALPSVDGYDEIVYQTNDILFWDDSRHENRPEWYSALANSGLIIGENCDEFFTTETRIGFGNGLGVKATVEQLAGYSTILYTSGAAYRETIIEADAILLVQWLELGDKNLLVTGDDLMSDLHQGYSAARQLLDYYIGVEVHHDELPMLISGQSSPLIAPEGSWGFYPDVNWIAHGGCPQVNSFDAVVALDHSIRLASFTNPSGTPDYPYTAMTICETLGTVVSLPYGLEFILTDPQGGGNSTGMSARSLVLRYALDLFGVSPIFPTDTPEAISLQVDNFPNPFNPSTTIEFVLPKAEHLSVKVYDLRGKLVSTLVDEQRAAGPGQVVWAGTNDQGGEVSSGVYFYQLKAGDEVRVRKMSLIK